jgi:hypothetical protein
MYCTNCGQQLPVEAKFCSKCGAEVPPKRAEVKTKQDIDTVAGDATGIVANEGVLDKGIKASSEQTVGTVESGGTMTGMVIGSNDSPTYVGGQHEHREETHNQTVFDQRGQHVGTQHNVAGDMHQQGGDTVNTGGGDYTKVGGDQTTVTGSTGVAVGEGAQATVTQGLSAEDISKLFAPIHQKIVDLPDDPDLDKKELTETVQKIEQEVVKGEEASPKKVERWLKTVALMSEDIFDVATATLINPVAGIATVIKKVAAKAREEANPT